jgi:hypothetical protein
MELSHFEFWKGARALGIDIHMLSYDGPFCYGWIDGEPFGCADDWRFVTCDGCKRHPEYAYWLTRGIEHAPM